MKKFAILAIALILFVQGVAAQDDNAKLREEIRKLDMDHAAAIFSGDAEALDILMDDDVTVKKSIKRRYTNVWMNRDGNWRLTVRHANSVCPDTSEK